MPRAALIGCGKIADSHAEQMRRIPRCEIVAACDREPLMARQFCERYQVPQAFSDVGELLASARPDVVHITTPPQSHLAIARQCLEHGVHVYVEKPFTVDAVEAEELIQLVRRTGLKLTVGHDLQFSPAAVRLRRLIRDGYLGGDPVHMESHFGYELSGAYARALLSDPDHWVRRLPGGLLQNIINHGIARIAEFIRSDRPAVMAHGAVSPLLRSMGETGINDELRVLVSEPEGCTAYFTFSTQMRPSLHQFRIYGPRNGLLLDEDQQLVLRLDGRRRKSYLERFVSPWSTALQYAGNVLSNARAFIRNEAHMKEGLHNLIREFYASIEHSKPEPIPCREILLTTRIMDEIFTQVSDGRASGAGSATARCTDVLEKQFTEHPPALQTR
jgi:predicted dehydrogenase